MNGPSWILGHLEQATRAHHVGADAPRMALLREPCLERYGEYLARLYAFESPIEMRWLRTLGLEQKIDLGSRLRARYLAADLVALGYEPEVVPAPPFAGMEQALGWMYVVERGRRMNGLLHRHLARRLPHAMAIAGTYLATSSPLGLRWQGLGVALDRVTRSGPAVDQVVNAANRAFRALRALPGRAPAHAA
jgi:heme oxygenase